MKHVIDKNRIAESSSKLSVTFILLEISVWLTPLTKQYETVRYIQQFTVIFTVIFGVIALRSLRKLIPKTLRRAILDKFLFAVRKAASSFAGFSRRILGFLGVKFDRYKKRKDEKTFIFGDDDELGRRKRHSIKSTSKWRDMTENSEKIRFLYIKYIVKLIKGGYKFQKALTPNEVRGDLALEPENEDNMLFDLYNGARYSGGSTYITDEQVEAAVALVNGKKK